MRGNIAVVVVVVVVVEVELHNAPTTHYYQIIFVVSSLVKAIAGKPRYYSTYCYSLAG